MKNRFILARNASAIRVAGLAESEVFEGVCSCLIKVSNFLLQQRAE